MPVTLFAEFQFLRPWWLLALLPLLFVLWLLWRRRGDDDAWREVCEAHLLQHLLIAPGAGERPLPLLLLALGWLLAVVALAGPTWDRYAQSVYQSLDARVIVLDLSRSMDATDLKPSRISRARFKVADILKRSQDGQTALVVFAGAAFTVVPLTQDSDTIAALLPALQTDIMPGAGSRVDLGLNNALQLLKQTGAKQGQVVLVSDAIPDERALSAANELRAAGFTLLVLGIGTVAGAPIPESGGDLLKNSAGDIVIARLDATALETLAVNGGGRYVTLRVDNSDLDALLDQAVLTAQMQRAEQQAETWYERGPWLFFMLLPLAALAFRRGWLALLLLFIGPPPSYALGWDDLWWRLDQQVQRALDRGAADRARQIARDPWQRGTAAYRAGDYEQAAQAFRQVAGAVGYYNYANALAQLARYEKALAAYDAALAENPEYEDARFNRALVAELIEQQSQPNQDQNPGQDEQPRDENDTRRSDQQSNQGAKSEREGEQSRRDQGQDQQSDPDSGQQDQGEPEQEQQSAAVQDRSGEAEQEEQLQPGRADDDILNEEQQQALEQWLRRIPDDPRGLLRRKFQLQYRRLAQPPEAGAQTW